MLEAEFLKKFLSKQSYLFKKKWYDEKKFKNRANRHKKYTIICST